MSRDGQVVSGVFCSSEGCIQVASEGLGCGVDISHQGPALLVVHTTDVQFALVLLSMGSLIVSLVRSQNGTEGTRVLALEKA